MPCFYNPLTIQKSNKEIEPNEQPLYNIDLYEALPEQVSSCLESFYLFGKFLPVREVKLSIYLIRTDRKFPNGKSVSYKIELEL